MNPNTMIKGSQLVTSFQKGRENFSIDWDAIVEGSFKVIENSIKGLNLGLGEGFVVD